MITDQSNWPQWLINAVTSDANVQIINGMVVWHDGVWQDGVWYGGVWRGGEWYGGVWRGGVWQDVRGDFFDVLLRTPHEVPGLIAALKEGRVNGSAYEDECACLCGTIANLRNCRYTEIPGVTPNASRPIERFFLAIKKGSTPENNPWCKQAVKWAEEFLRLIDAIKASPEKEVA